MPDPHHAALEDRVLVAERRVLGQVIVQPGDEVTQLGQPVLGQVVGHAAGADVVVVHAQAGERLEEVEDHFALTEADRHHGQRADLHAAGADGDQVGGDPAQFHDQHAQLVGALGDLVFDAQQALDRQTVGGLIEQRRHVVHAGHEGAALNPAAVLHGLLDASVEEADGRTDLDHGLAVTLQLQAKDAVGGGVLRAHVDDHGLVAALSLLLRDLGPVATHRRVDGVGRLVAGPGVEVASGCAHRYVLR